MGIDEVKRPAVFLDRDGVLVEEVYYPEFDETEAPMHPGDVRLLPGAAAAASKLRALGHILVVVSNQGAAAKGKVGLGSLWGAHLRFIALMAAEGVAFDAEYYSFSHPAGTVPGLSGPSLDRKPSPYNLLIAAARFDIDLGRSWMVGDRETDVACGRAAGCRTIRVGCASETEADHRVADLPAAADIIAVGFAPQ